MASKQDQQETSQLIPKTLDPSAPTPVEGKEAKEKEKKEGKEAEAKPIVDEDEAEKERVRPKTSIRRIIGIAFVISVAFALPVLYNIETTKGLFRSSNANGEEDGFQFNRLSKMCQSPLPHQFVMENVKTNDTVLVFVLPQANIQLTNVLHRGSLVHSELQNFQTHLTYIYPAGRLSSSDATCVQLQMGTGGQKEESWNDLACRKQGKMFIEANQMRLVQDVAPALDLPSDFFEMPIKCASIWQQESVNVTPPPQVWQPRASRFMTVPTNSSLEPEMLDNVLNLIGLEFGTNYAGTPRLASILGTLYELHAGDYLTTANSFHVDDYTTNATSAEIECCGGPDNIHCIQQIQNSPNLAAQCQTYRQCVSDEEMLWQQGGLGTPFRTCNGYDERRCHCDHQFANVLMTPGVSECGDCLNDPSKCDCYLTIWFLHYMYLQRPCWCQGACVHAPFPFFCDVKDPCYGWVTKTCEYFLTWCMRTEAYPCYGCHSAAFSDDTNLCLITQS